MPYNEVGIKMRPAFLYRLHRHEGTFMKVSRLISTILVVVGIVPLYYGYTSIQSPVNKIYKAVTGRHAAHTLRHLVGSAAAVLSGGQLDVFDRK